MKAIFFDVDWVLVRTERFSLQYQRKFDIDVSTMLPFFTWVFQDCLIWKADLKIEVEPWLGKRKWIDWVDEFLKFRFKAEHHIDKKVVSLVRELKNKWIICYAATNQEKYRTEYMKNNMWFDGLFDAVYSSADIWYKKPDRDFFDFLIEHVSNTYWITDSSEILFFDDDVENVEWAKKSGLMSYHYEELDDLTTVLKNYGL